MTSITEEFLKQHNKFRVDKEARKAVEQNILNWVREISEEVEWETKFFNLNWVLSDWTIKDFIKLWVIWIETTAPDLVTQDQIMKHINVSTADVTLARDFKRFKSVEWWILDLKDKDKEVEYEEILVEWDEWIVIQPWEFILWRTNEIIDLPSFIDCIIISRSSIARVGLQIESAWYIDALFRWTITLEMVNFNKFPIKVYPWQRIWQFRFEFLDKIPETTYDKKKDSKYQGQIWTTVSWIKKDNL